MGALPNPFDDFVNFWQSARCYDGCLWQPDKSWCVERLDFTMTVAAISEE